MEKSTLSAWERAPGVGDRVPFPYDTDLLAFATGQKFQPIGSLLRLHDELLEAAESDPALLVVRQDCIHFTFLALSPHAYSGPANYPDRLLLLKRICREHLEGLDVAISSLRLVPLPNALLLAGIPDEKSLGRRSRFAAALLESEWADLIRARYGVHPIPPIIWHTTLARCRNELLPQAVRSLFFQYRDRSFEDIGLGQPILAAVAYDWSRIFPIPW